MGLLPQCCCFFSTSSYLNIYCHCLILTRSILFSFFFFFIFLCCLKTIFQSLFARTARAARGHLLLCHIKEILLASTALAISFLFFVVFLLCPIHDSSSVLFVVRERRKPCFMMVYWHAMHAQRNARRFIQFYRFVMPVDSYTVRPLYVCDENWKICCVRWLYECTRITNKITLCVWWMEQKKQRKHQHHNGMHLLWLAE